MLNLDLEKPSFRKKKQFFRKRTEETSLKRSVSYLIIIPLILLSFIFGFWLSSLDLRRAERIQDDDFSLFFEAWETIERHFIDIDEIDRQKILQGAISGMIEALEDPYTRFLNTQETELKLKELRGEFEGIGARLDKKDNILTITKIFDNAPAQKTGLQIGDEIIKINGKNTENLPIYEAVSLIRGEKGTDVILLILRENWKNGRAFIITRDIIKIPSVEWELKNNKIAYIQIRKFTRNTSRDFSKAVNEILDSPANRIILDLRNNPGGSLSEVIQIANYFLKKNDIILIKRRKNEEEKVYQEFDGKLLKLPVIVLINQFSASGAEILAVTLRDNKRITLIGETTLGKGSVQKMIKLHDSHSLLITTTEWLTPAGNHISEIGVIPCITIEKTLQDIIEGRDPQLKKAIEILQSKK